MQVLPVVPWSMARIKTAAAYPAGIFPLVVREAADGVRGGAM
jgi:hypothetical protein